MTAMEFPAELSTVQIVFEGILINEVLFTLAKCLDGVVFASGIRDVFYHGPSRWNRYNTPQSASMFHRV
jgi:hypothetical protein